MDPASALHLAVDPCVILQAQGITPDAWQREFLLSTGPVILNCCRGAGKSRTTSALADHVALFPRPQERNGSLVLIVSRTEEQAREVLRYCKQGMQAIGWPVKAVAENMTNLELANGSRIVAMPGKESSIRSKQAVSLLIMDEASRIPDDLFGTVSPMTAISGGRQVMLSTPFGQRGFFWREWFDERAAWTRFRVPWQRCPRHTAAYIEEERRKFGDGWVAQEYECSFEALSGLVYPQFEELATFLMGPVMLGRKVGGIDWGFRNPFAAEWGVLDRDDILWIENERYVRECGVVRGPGRSRGHPRVPGRGSGGAEGAERDQVGDSSGDGPHPYGAVAGEKDDVPEPDRGGEAVPVPGRLGAGRPGREPHRQ
jgi:Helicase